jgi:hypothetical protein
MDVPFLDNHVPEVDADPEYDPLILGRFGIALGHPVLDGDRASDGLHDAREFQEQPVTGRLDDAAFVLGDFRIDEFAAMGTKARECAGFVLAHEAAVTGDIGGEDGRKPALYPLSAYYALRCGGVAERAQPGLSLCGSRMTANGIIRRGTRHGGVRFPPYSRGGPSSQGSPTAIVSASAKLC